MSKKLFIAEKPSVAKEFAKTLGVSGNAGRVSLDAVRYNGGTLHGRHTGFVS